MPRRSGVTSVCPATLLYPLLALLIAGCGRPGADRVALAKQGIGRIVYKQLNAVARAAESVEPEAADDDEADAVEHAGELAPAAPTDVPPGSWVAAFPAPDVPPMPLAQAGPLPAAEAPAQAQAAVPPPEPVAALEQPPPSIAAEPAPAVLPEPQAMVFVPGGGNGSPVVAAAPQLPAMPALDMPAVNLLVVVPILLPAARVDRHAPAHPQAGARLQLGGRTGLRANVQRR